MRLVDFTCSRCNALLQVNPELKKCICQYCGNEMLIDDEIQKRQVEFTNAFEFGYQQEMGRQKAIEDYQKQKQLEQQTAHQVSEILSNEAQRIQKENKRFEAVGLAFSVLGLIPFFAIFFVMQIGSLLVCVKLYRERKKYQFNKFIVILTFVLTIIDTVIAVMTLHSMV